MLSVHGLKSGEMGEGQVPSDFCHFFFLIIGVLPSPGYYMTRFFFLFKIYFISIMCVSVCLWVPRRPEQDILSSGASIVSPTWVPGTKIQSSA